MSTRSKPIAINNSSKATKAVKPKKTKKQIETMLDKKYPLSNANYELSYDYDIKPQYLEQMRGKGIFTMDRADREPNLNLINKLPSFRIKTDIEEIANIQDEPDEEMLETNTYTGDDLDIDKEGLEKETIGDKSYYLDHDKGIIYDMSYNNVGYIDEIGELVINE